MSDINRGSRQKIRLIKINEPFSPHIVFGLSYPEQKPERGQIDSNNNSHNNPAAGREQKTDTIDIPLPVREQTILSYRVDASVRKMINGMAPMEHSRVTPAFRQDIEVSVSSTMINTSPAQKTATQTQSSHALRAEKTQPATSTDSSTNSNPITGRYLS